MVPNRRNGTYFILRARLKKEARRGGPKPGRVTGSSLPGSENANEYFKHRAPEFNAWVLYAFKENKTCSLACME
mgnify:CR=1 FL=1